VSEGGENSTVSADLRPLVPSVPFLELRIRGPHGSRDLPFLHNPMDFRLHHGNGAPPEWSVELSAEHRLHFQCRSQTCPLMVKLVGEEVMLGDERVTVVDLRSLPPYRLVSLSSGLGYRAWCLSDGNWTVGRPGKRHNNVVLEAASVSRTHARLEIRDKAARLVAEAEGALTALNGQRLGAGRAYDLQPNDVLQFGELLFRWEREERVLFQSPDRLRLKGLGMACVSLGTARQDAIELRNEKARNLLFWAASLRGAELSVERILEEYWPERPPLRQRKNLSHCLKAMQSELGWSEGTFTQLLTRSSETLRLDPSAVESFDVWSLQEALRRSPREALDLSELLDLHPAPLLPHWEGSWVRPLRTELFLSWLAALLACSPRAELQARLGETVGGCLRDGDFEEFVYEKAFEIAARFSLHHLIRAWLSELRERTLASTGDVPSQDLQLFGERLAGRIGTGSDPGLL
jgi:hypothetical protein